MKSAAERSIEALTWASVVIWLGFMLVTDGLGYAWLVLMVLGIILLSSAIYQRSRNWDTSLAIWIFGIWMAVFSVIETVNEIVKSINEGEGLSIDLGVYLGIALVSMGVATVLRIVQGPRLASAYGLRGQQADFGAQQTSTRGAARDPRPRVVQDEYGDGNYAAQQGPRAYQSGQEWSPSTNSTRARRGTARSRTRGAARQDYAAPRQELDAQGQYADYNDPNQGYAQEPPQTGREAGYSYESAQYPAPNAGQGQQQYDDLYDERGWDAAPQTQRYVPPAPDPRRQQSSGPGAPAPDDLESRVQDIIRRSRERRNVSSEDLPY